jgi:hypothetical protein
LRGEILDGATVHVTVSTKGLQFKVGTVKKEAA